MKPVLRLPAAVEDVDAIAAYLYSESPPAGERFATRFDEAMTKLGERPAIGRTREDIARRLGTIRSLAIDGFPNHLIFYKETEDAVLIVRVMHGARRLTPRLFGGTS
jgi:plasmid stabilization system protein ParE